MMGRERFLEIDGEADRPVGDTVAGYSGHSIREDNRWSTFKAPLFSNTLSARSASSAVSLFFLAPSLQPFALSLALH
jgi:hypothetical protein